MRSPGEHVRARAAASRWARAGAASALAWACGCSGRAAAVPASSSVGGVFACPEIAGANPWEDLLGTHALADRGTLLACAHVATYTQDDVATSAYFSSSLGAAANGYDLYVVQYVSEGQAGAARAVTGLLYLPSGGGTDIPMIAVDHGTSGLGPSCGPSHDSAITDPIAVPFVALGYAVTATDYQGMGVDNGMTSYLVGAEEAAATLDAVRALRGFRSARFDASQLGKDLFVLGHSQGGHAALFTHQLFDATLGVDFLGSVAFAPALGSAAVWLADIDVDPAIAGDMAGLVAMSLYTRMLVAGGPDAGSWLSSSASASLPGVLHDECVPEVLSTISGQYPRKDDLYQATFVSAATGCTTSGSCSGFEPWASAFVAEEPGSFKSSVPSLILQGLSDVTVPPATVACIVDRMTKGGGPVQACAYEGADHSTVISEALPDVVQWMQARRAGTTPAACGAALSVACGP